MLPIGIVLELPKAVVPEVRAYAEDLVEVGLVLDVDFLE